MPANSGSNTSFILWGAILTPLLTLWLSRAFPPRGGGYLEWESLRARYNSLELWAQLACVLTLIAAVALLIVYRVKSAWQIGAAFGSLVLVPVLLIALVTLRHGVDHWRQFWRFYELKYRISLRFLAPTYTFIILLGVVSAAVLLFT